MSDETDVGGGPSTPKRRRGGGKASELKRVAEMVMVLSAMAEIRGGREPTPAERSLAVEARRLLAAACESVRPKELFTGEAVRIVVEDLGLNRSKDPLIGFRAPKMSIAEKIQLTKRKMDESKELSAQSASQSSQLNAVNYGGKHESQGTSFHGPPRILPDKSNTVWPSTGGLQTASHAGYASQLSSSTSTTKQLQVNDTQGSISSANPFNNSLEKDTQFKPLQPESHHFRFDMRAPGSVHFSQVRGSASAGYIPERSPTTPVQLSSAATLKAGQSNKQLNHGLVKSEGASGINVVQPSHQEVKSQGIKTHVTSTSPANLPNAHQPPHGLAVGNPTPIFTCHIDIAKSVQRFFQPKVPDQPSWTPPSTEYMNTPISCEVCKMTIADVESLLICDHCDKGTHLKCLQSYGNKGLIPKSDWHCPKCLHASHGKPLPPKYGRVTRAATVSKGPSNPTENQSQPPMEKRAEGADVKTNRQKQVYIGNPSLPNYSQDFGTANKLTPDSSAPKIPGMQNSFTPPMDMDGENMASSDLSSRQSSINTEANFLSPAEQTPSLSKQAENNENMDRENMTSSDLSSRQSNINTEANFLTPVEQTEGFSKQAENSDISASELQTPDTVSNIRSGIVKEEPSIAFPSQFSSESQFGNVNVTNSGENTANQSPITTVCTTDDSIKPTVPRGTSESQLVSLTPDHGNSSVRDTRGRDGKIEFSEMPRDTELPTVDWVDETLRVAEEKTYYQSCRINNDVYKLQDDVVAYHDQILKPLKLLALWEDNNAGLKWASFRRYYLPSELPGTAPLPQFPESNEVYASNNEQILLAGVINGHCEVHILDQLREEAGIRAQLPDGSSSAVPIFICRWKYDESGGTFQPVTD